MSAQASTPVLTLTISLTLVLSAMRSWEWDRSFERRMVPLPWGGTTAMLAEDLPDRARRVRQSHPQRLKRLILIEVVQDCLGARGAVEVGGRLVTDLEDAVNDVGVDRRWGMLASARTTMEQVLIRWSSIPQASDPLLDPADRALGRIGEILLGVKTPSNAPESATRLHGNNRE